MLSLKALISLAALAAVTQAVVHNNNGAKVIRIFAQSNQVFRPNSVQARKGDVLEFHFEGGNHSVVAGEYQHPCSPLPIGSGFFSGFFAVDKGQLQSPKIFRVTVNNTESIVYYSSQNDECSKGMVGIVNPNNTQTWDDYKKRASELAKGVTPSGSSYGGTVVDNPEMPSPSPAGSKDKDKDGKKSSAAGAARAPFFALAFALGTIALFA